MTRASDLLTTLVILGLAALIAVGLFQWATTPADPNAPTCTGQYGPYGAPDCE